MRGFTALLFSGVVAFGASAVAQPNGEWRDGRRHEHDDRRAYNVDRDQWVTLARGAMLEGRSVRVPLGDARLHAIELQATRGGADIIAVGVVYTDGRHEPVTVNQSLDARHSPNLRIDLPREGRVHEIVVQGRGRVGFRVIGG